MMLSAERLSAILNDFKLVFFGKPHDGRHRGWMPEEVYGNDRPGSGRDLLLDFLRIDVEGVGFNIDKNGDGLQQRNDLCRGDEGERRRDDLVSGTDSAGAQRQKQCVRAAGDADRESPAVISGNFLFEGGHVRSQDELGLTHDILHGGIDVRFQLLILSLQVHHGDHNILS